VIRDRLMRYSIIHALPTERTFLASYSLFLSLFHEYQFYGFKENGQREKRGKKGGRRNTVRERREDMEGTGGNDRRS